MLGYKLALAAAMVAVVASKSVATPPSFMKAAREVAEARNVALKERIDAGQIDRVTVQTKYGAVTGLALVSRLLPCRPIDITVQTNYGAVTVQNKSTQFLGVPFATPPVGNRRW